MKKALYPASFDPITYGHMDVISQALKVFDKIVIAPLVNSNKSSSMFTTLEKTNLIKEIYKDEPRVDVLFIPQDITAVDVALDNGCTTMIRGLRNSKDFEDELGLCHINLLISDGKINTVAFFTNPTKANISSSAVKQLARYGKNIDNFVHPIVKSAINKKLGKE